MATTAILQIPQIRSLKNDLEFGLEEEKKIIDVINKHLCEPFGETKYENTKVLYDDDYCYYDFEGDVNHTQIEAKSRRNKKWQYPTTIIPVHKARDECENTQLFLFNFTDEVCYIKYDKEVFSKFATRYIKVQRQGKWDPPTLHYFIPITSLIDIN